MDFLHEGYSDSQVSAKDRSSKFNGTPKHNHVCICEVQLRRTK